MLGQLLGRTVGGAAADLSTTRIKKYTRSRIRTPGEDFEPDRIGECIYPMVWRARQNDKYNPPSLHGFRRFPAKGRETPYWTKTYKVYEAEGLACRAVSNIPGLGAKTASKIVTVKVSEFVIPAKIAKVWNHWGFPVGRALIINSSNRVGWGPERIRKARERATDKEGWSL